MKKYACCHCGKVFDFDECAHEYKEEREVFGSPAYEDMVELYCPYCDSYDVEEFNDGAVDDSFDAQFPDGYVTTVDGEKITFEEFANRLAKLN